MKIAYINCFAGAAGDMLTAALIDAGVDQNLIRQAILSFNIEELEDISVDTVSRCGVRALKFNPVLKSDEHHCHDNHNHTHSCDSKDEHSHTHDHSEHNSHHHEHAHGNDAHTHHHHGHDHSHSHHSHEIGSTGSASHVHRGLNDIIELINKSDITDNARKNAIAVFEKVAHAEAHIHQKGPQEVHFHEVGAVDSIVDIVAVCVALDMLNIDRIYCSQISVGGGTVKCAHGIMPVPAPATAKLLEAAPIKGGPIDKELLTPTGAALLTHFTDEFGKMPAMSIDSIGYGAGTMDPDTFANVTAVYIGQTVCSADTDAETDQICLLETNIDDATGESIGDLAQKLRLSNALDVAITPIYMKNSRPASRLSVMCESGTEEKLEAIILKSGLTLGLQKNYLTRSKLIREIKPVKTEFGDIDVKIGRYKGEVVFVKAECSVCQKIAASKGVTLRQVAAVAEQNARETLFCNP